MAISNLRQKSIFDQFNIPDLSGGTLGYGLDMNTSFMPDAKSPTYEDENTFRSSNLAGDMRTPEDIQGIGSASNISKVSDVSTRPPQQDYGEISLPDTMKAINDLYTPATRADDRLNKLLDNTPDINDYNPSFARKLVAGLQSIKDPNQGQKTLNQPYLQDMGQWKEKTTPFQAAATGENARNTQERTLAGNVVTSITAQNRNAANQRIADQKNETTRARDVAKAESDRIRARAAAYSASLGKGYDWDLTGPTAKKINKSTGDIVDTGIETGKLNEETRIDMQNEGKIEAARVLGEGATSRQAASGVGNIKVGNQVLRPDPDNPGNYIPVTGLPAGTPSRLGTGDGAGTRPNALETARERDAKLQSIFENNNPEETQFLKRDRNTGKVTFLPRPVVGATKPGTTTLGFGGTPYTKDDLTRWDQLKAELEPGYVPPPSGSPAATQGLGPRQPPPVPQQPLPPVQQQQPPKPYNPTSPFQIQESAPPSSPDWWNNLNKPTGNPAVLENQNAITRLTRVLNDPNVPNEMKDSIFNQIQALTLKQELLENPQAVQQMNQSNAQLQPQYEIKTNPNNPNEKVRSVDGGRTMDFSHDGGRTWGPR